MTVDITKYLREGATLVIPGLDLTALVQTDPGDGALWEPVNPDQVKVLKWPRKDKAGQLDLPSTSRKETYGGWVAAVGANCSRVQVGDQVTFLPLNFSRSESETDLFRGTEEEKTLDTAIGYVMEAELDQKTKETR